MIQVCTPFLLGNEKKYVLDCLKKNYISSSGYYLKAFEEAFSRYCGKKFGITTTSGTTALLLSLAALGIGPGDEVIVPAFSIASTAFAVIYCGAKPVLVDSDPITFNMDAGDIERKITKKTKAIMPVHTYGHPCDMDLILQMAKKYYLRVIEDAAEAHGAEFQGQKVGGIGDVGCFSFYGNKIITCGEGGMVVTDDEKIAERCRRLKNLAFQDKKRFWHEEIGFNYRMTNLQAALGLAQLENIEEFVERRRRNAGLYTRLLSCIRELTLPVEQSHVKNVFWMYGILVEKKFGMSRDQLIEELRKVGVETRTFFWPLHKQPALRKQGLFRGERYSVAEDIAKKGLYLPSGSNLTKKEIEYVCRMILKIRARQK